MAPKTPQDHSKTPPRRSSRGLFLMFEFVFDFGLFWVPFWPHFGIPNRSFWGSIFDLFFDVAPKGPQEAFKNSQEAPKGAPRGFQEAPKRPQEAPRGPQEASKRPPRAQKASTIASPKTSVAIMVFGHFLTAAVPKASVPIMVFAHVLAIAFPNTSVHIMLLAHYLTVASPTRSNNRV